ncbi:hypothetical protein NDU88_000007 [Pleurodeles waltl]|uniref:Uncharacterized protein n=1 Tax=Pleurodeles waltl TaxID=8319 RepID=A0AAV7NZI2_PLEWA|nr:hypothetical protein NDU88_000007 [Pleurodeles waltl]
MPPLPQVFLGCGAPLLWPEASGAPLPQVFLGCRSPLLCPLFLRYSWGVGAPLLCPSSPGILGVWGHPSRGTRPGESRLSFSGVQVGLAPVAEKRPQPSGEAADTPTDPGQGRKLRPDTAPGRGEERLTGRGAESNWCPRVWNPGLQEPECSAAAALERVCTAGGGELTFQLADSGRNPGPGARRQTRDSQHVCVMFQALPVGGRASRRTRLFWEHFNQQRSAFWVL